MFVEDAVSAQGPIVVEVNPTITVAELKVQIEAEFEIPVDVQKWILGKQLVGEETVTLQSQGVTEDGAEIYLYLVNPGEKPASPAQQPQKIPLVLPTEPNQKGRYWNYEEDRWSFCNSDEDEDRERLVADANANKEEAGGAEKHDEDEWEYYYDDVNVVVKEEAAAEPQKHLEQQPQHQPQPQPQPQPQVNAVRVDGWECPMCTLVNPLERPGCLACTTDRPPHLGAEAVMPQPEIQEKKPTNNLDAYKQLENLDIIPNAENFECTICYLDIEPGDGVMLRECLHTFCK